MSHAVDTQTLMKSSSFDRVFRVQPLDQKESREIELMLVDSYQPSQVSEEQVGDDYRQMCQLTAEIRAINKQQVVLIGERIWRAREVLKRYGDGNNTFTDWLEKVFGSRRTAYNMLSYFELHEQLSIDLRTKFKKLPLKAAYCLAGRKAPIEKKCEIISGYEGERPDELILYIQSQLPAGEGDGRRKSGNQMMLTKMRDLFKTLQVRGEHFSEAEKTELKELFESLKTVIET